MFILAGREARAEIREQSEIDSVISKLEDGGGKSILRSMVKSACQSLGCPPYALKVHALINERSAYRRMHGELGPIGDLIAFPERIFLLYPSGKRLHAWELRHHTTESGIADFCASIENAIKVRLDGRRVRGMSFDWRDTKTRLLPRRLGMRPGYFQEEQLKARKPEYTAEELDQSQLMRSAEHRDFMLGLAQVGKARSVDAATVVDEGITEPLLGKKLIRKEYLVTCRKDSRTLCTVSDRSQLAAGIEMNCVSCGRPFKDELIQEIFSLTESGRNLLTSSKWMTIWVTDLLVQSGIPLTDIGWNPEAAAEELDIVVTVQGERALFELKNREFGLGDAYPFGFRVERYRGSVGVIATTDKVSDDAKRLFRDEVSQRRGVDIDFLEGEQDIESRMSDLMERLSKRAIERFFVDFSEQIGIDLRPLIQTWMDSSVYPKAVTSIAR